MLPIFTLCTLPIVCICYCTSDTTNMYITVHYTPSAGTLCILLHTLPVCTLITVLYTLPAVQCTVTAYVLAKGQYTPCAYVVTAVLHTLNMQTHATLLYTLTSTLPLEANHFVSVLFLLLLKITGIYFSCFLTYADTSVCNTVTLCEPVA
jgi:hypothetical protein